MIEQIDGRLKSWAESVLTAAPVSFAPPTNAQPGKGVSLYLLEIVPLSPVNTSRRSPLQFALRYLVTTWSGDPLEAHSLLAQLIFAALENAEFEVELAPLSATEWTALGAIPRPSFMLRVPVRKERPEPGTKLVRKPIVVQTAPLAVLSGIILGPGDVPLVQARVELPSLQRVEHTDLKGRFVFSAVPAEPKSKDLLIRAKGREMSIKVDHEDSLVIHFDLGEE